jgi:hypothetical protein
MKYALIAAGLLAAFILWRRSRSTAVAPDLGSPSQVSAGFTPSPPSTTANQAPTTSGYRPPLTRGPQLAATGGGIISSSAPSTGYTPPARGPQVGSPVPAGAPPALAPPGEPSVTRQEASLDAPPTLDPNGYVVKMPALSFAPSTPAPYVATIQASTGPKFQARSGRGAF